MLYDPKWGKPNLQGFIDWLRGQDPCEPFDYIDITNCAVAQYYRSLGLIAPSDADLKIAPNATKTASVLAGCFTFGDALAACSKINLLD